MLIIRTYYSKFTGPPDVGKREAGNAFRPDNRASKKAETTLQKNALQTVEKMIDNGKPS